MNKFTPEHIIKLAFIAGITVIVSLMVIFAYLAGLFLPVVGIIAGLAFVILAGYGLGKMMID